MNENAKFEDARDLLYRSFDERLPPRERARLEAALDAWPQLRVEREEIAALRGALQELPAPTFGPFFAESTMAAIAARRKSPAWLDAFDALAAAFRPAALAASLVVAVLAAVNIWPRSASASPDAEGFSDVDQAYALFLEEEL